MNDETNLLTEGLRLNPPADAHLVERVQAELGLAFPLEYATFMAQYNGAEGWVGKRYLILYPLDQLVSLNSVGIIGEQLPGLTLFGSDGGGMDYLFDARCNPPTIVTGPDIGATLATLRFCADDLRSFLAYLFALEAE